MVGSPAINMEIISRNLGDVAQLDQLEAAPPFVSLKFQPQPVLAYLMPGKTCLWSTVLGNLKHVNCVIS